MDPRQLRRLGVSVALGWDDVLAPPENARVTLGWDDVLAHSEDAETKAGEDPQVCRTADKAWLDATVQGVRVGQDVDPSWVPPPTPGSGWYHPDDDDDLKTKAFFQRTEQHNAPWKPCYR